MTAREHLLILDDDPGLTRLLSSVLKDRGYDVAAATSGAQALESIQKKLPTLVVLDLQLGDMDATTFVARLREENIDLPFICISGQGDERTAVEMMKLGALEYMLKDTQLIHFVPVVVEKALAQIDLKRKLQESEIQRERLEAELLEISERERRNIGHDLHDGLGQRLTALALVSHALCEQIRQATGGRGIDLGRILNVVQQINGDLREAISETRRLARGLGPVALDSSDLSSALQGLAESVHQEYGPRTCFNSPEPIAVEDVSVAGHLYRIAQEALNNALKHSQGRSISIDLHQEDDHLELSVADDGVGIPLEGSARPGMGLRVMDYRARLIGATLEVVPRAGWRYHHRLQTSQPAMKSIKKKAPQKHARQAGREDRTGAARPAEISRTAGRRPSGGCGPATRW